MVFSAVRRLSLPQSAKDPIMLKTVRTPHGRKFKFGRKQTIARGPRLSLGNYLLRTFPDPPRAMDYTPKALPFLNNVYGNDIAGDCTCAGIYHCKAVILANSGKPVTVCRW